MLFGKEVPFPDHPTCKLCVTRPCKRLLSGRVYPGKMIAVHHSEFLSWPCHTPVLKPQDDESGEEVALTDDIEMVTGKVEITNPRWKPIEEAEEGGDPEIPLMGDKVRLLADVKNYPDGAPVSFDIYDVTEQTPLRITTVKGNNDNGTASVEWTVEDPQKRGESLKLSFEAGARSKYTEKAELPWQDKIRCDFVEMSDVLFHDNSAVPCLDEEGVLLGAFTAAFRFAKENSDKEIVIFGHTDASGDTADSYDLSQWRAEGIKALLDNSSDAWLDIVDLASKVEDYQMILKALSSSDGWGCDPGDVDNADGPKTKAAVKAFQEEYNRRFSGNLKNDGIIGPKTWGAIFTTVRSLIEEAVKTETENEQLPELTYGYDGKGIYPCGESFPIDSAEKDNYKSATNRRVEVMFFDKEKVPQLKEPADKTSITKSEAPVYDARKVERCVIQGDADDTAVKTKTILEVEDVLFNLNSAVMLPAAPDSTTSEHGATSGEGVGIVTLQKKTTGLNVLRAIYRFIEQNNGKKLLIAGHTDTSGEIKPNFDLSDLRASNVLHLLLGEGDLWAETCVKKHQVEDYQQILKHYAGLLLWQCDPGKVDNKIGPLTRKAVTAFQELYNANRKQMGFSGGEIPVQEPSGNELNKETWRAIFDLYRWETAVITLGEQDAGRLNDFIDKVAFADENRKTLGCGESFPIDEKNKDNYKSQKNRRVELLFFDEEEAPESVDCPEPGDEKYTVKDVPFYDENRYTNDYVKITAPAFIPTLDIQSVDSLGQPIPNSSLTVTSDNEEVDSPYSKEVSTDGDAFIRLFGVPVGTVEIKDSGGKLFNMHIGRKEEAASFDPRNVMNGIISVIVQEVAPEIMEKRDKQRKTYSLIPTDDSTKLKPAGPREQQVQQWYGAGQTVRFLATDNLLMAAGLNDEQEADIEKLASDTLRKWLGDYFPVVIKRDYIVLHFFSVDSKFKLGVYSSKGKLLGTFDLTKNLVAPLGAYAIFESVSEQVFVDMVNRRAKIVTSDEPNQVYHVESIVAENQQEEISRLLRANSAKVPISYFSRSSAHFAFVSLAGGTGYLETYGESSGAMNSHIHERNKAVVKTHSLMYGAYIGGYIKQVAACTDEEQLRKLGPPMRGYRFPVPVGATDNQAVDLVDADNSLSAEYKAWLEIAKKINEFTGRRSEGFFFVAKYSYTKDISKFQKVQFEYNFNLDSDGKRLHKNDVKLLTEFKTEVNTKLKKKLTNKKVVAGVEHELSLTTGDSKVTGSLKVGKYGFELASDGSAKCSNGPISTEVNPEEKTFGAGVELENGGHKIYFGMHFQGLREDTVMAFVSNAPGFFERRSHKELLATTTKWNDLNYSEQEKLKQLGFTMEFWDDKHNHSLEDFPPSATKKYGELSATEKVAIVYLGFNSTTWPSLIKATAKQTDVFKPEPDVI